VISVCRDVGILCRFGDAKACDPGEDFGGTPDIVCMTDFGAARVVGEMKTPWMHDLDDAMSDPILWPRWLGQIAMYMWHSRCTYGFMSTYEQTVFLKQDVDPNNPNGYALWHSNVVHHNTQARPVGGVNPPAAAYQNCVSLRESFFFLGLEIQAGRWQANNPMARNDWYITG
jgi:hypothetical protein